MNLLYVIKNIYDIFMTFYTVSINIVVAYFSLFPERLYGFYPLF